ncbi:MAG: Hsp20/alpha crystallin family protein [Akkermansiaceae bacterium]|nr:Hsp20/alpha crystallin family protein [Akkermansiaceae bacterium]
MSNGLSQWDPFRDLSAFQQRLASMFGGEPGSLASSGDADWHPAVDIAEDDDAYTISADLPDVKKDDAKVAVKDGVLTISGERTREQEEKKKKFHRIERSYGSYTRSFQVPDNVDPSLIKAAFEDGVLTVVMPKSKASPPEEHHIEVN